MYNRIADKLADMLIRMSGRNEKGDTVGNKEVISYGLELILSSIVNLILVLVIGEWMYGIWETIIFIMLFCPIRQFSGGIHANSYLKCTIVFLALFTVVGNLFYIIDNIVSYFIICIVCIVYIGIMPPIDTENKRMSQELRNKCKKKVLFLLGIETVIIILFSVLRKKRFMCAAATAVFIESVLLAAGKIENRKTKEWVKC